jgi:SAM-dependent methyltransferase
MGLGWYDSSTIPFNALLLLERCHIGWFCAREGIPIEVAVAFNANQHVLWYFQHKNPNVGPWVRKVKDACPKELSSYDIRKMEIAVLESVQDWVAYVWDPQLYDSQPFVSESLSRILSTIDFSDKWTLDVGAGTGRLSFLVAPVCKVVYACEPVGNLRDYIREEAKRRNIRNLYVVDGMIEMLPFPDRTFDVVMGGYVFGDDMSAEMDELRRVTKTGGSIVLCPGNADNDNETHSFLIEQGFAWERYEESKGIIVRKYWTSVDQRAG